MLFFLRILPANSFIIEPFSSASKIASKKLCFLVWLFNKLLIMFDRSLVSLTDEFRFCFPKMPRTTGAAILRTLVTELLLTPDCLLSAF